MTTEARAHYARIFAILDPVGRGTISRDQVAIAVRLLNWNPTDQEIQQLLDDYENREFTYEEFVSFIDNGMPACTVKDRKEDLRLAFTVFDRSNSGWLDKATFVDILTKYGKMKLDVAETKSWVERLDRRRDGKIRIAELEELFISDEDVMTAIKEQKWDLV